MKSKSRRNKSKVLAGIILVFFLLIGIISSLILINQKQDNRQQAAFNGGVIISFKKIAPAPKNVLVSVPIYLNTQDIEINSLNLKVNVTGEVSNLGIKINQEMPIKKIAEKVEGKSILLSLSGSQANTGWSTSENMEFAIVTFTKEKDGEVWLSFDQKETLAQSSATDENVITTGDDVSIKIGTIAPAEVKQIQKEIIVDDNKEIVSINNNLLVGTIASSFIAVIMAMLYLLKSKKKKEFPLAY